MDSDSLQTHLAKPLQPPLHPNHYLILHWEGSNIALVPLRFESGTRFKILGAGACRIPVISTTLGAEGIPVTDGHDILIADEPETFAEAILRLIQDPQFADQISTNLHQLIKQQYTISTLVSEGKKILSEL